MTTAAKSTVPLAASQIVLFPTGVARTVAGAGWLTGRSRAALALRCRARRLVVNHGPGGRCRQLRGDRKSFRQVAFDQHSCVQRAQCDRGGDSQTGTWCSATMRSGPLSQQH